jgi:hypothetical protein
MKKDRKNGRSSGKLAAMAKEIDKVRREGGIGVVQRD